MRQQAMENLLKKMEEEVDKFGKPPYYMLNASDIILNLRNLCAKSQILRSRKNDAAVLRELGNESIR